MPVSKVICNNQLNDPCGGEAIQFGVKLIPDSWHCPYAFDSNRCENVSNAVWLNEILSQHVAHGCFCLMLVVRQEGLINNNVPAAGVLYVG